MLDCMLVACAFLLSISCAVYFFHSRRMQTIHSKLFAMMLINMTVASGAEVVTDILQAQTRLGSVLFVVMYTMELIYFIVHNLLPPMYAIYTFLINGVAYRKSKSFYMVFLAPTAVVMLLLLSNPFTNLIFYFDSNMKFVRGPLELVAYIVAGGYILFGIYYMLRFKKAVSRRVGFSIWYFFSFSIMGILIQFFFPDIEIELFAEALSSMGIMLIIENEGNYIDHVSGAYNRLAFREDNKRFIESGNKYMVAYVSITNMRVYMRMLGNEGVESIMRHVVRWLLKLKKGVLVYRISGSVFGIIMMYKDDEEVKLVTKKLKKRFKKKWKIDDGTIDLNATIVVAKIPEEISGINEVLDLSEDMEFIENNGVRVIYGSRLEGISRQGRVERAIKEGIDNNRFEVYYQPIWNCAEDRINSAEALLRLNDPELGSISPGEFIPIAEKCGLITSVGEFVFESVCRFLATDRVKNLNMEYVEINLSIYQLMDNDLPDKLTDSIVKYGLRPNMINMEITESATLEGERSFSKEIGKIGALGIGFSLDDYGTGYSNLKNIMNMDYVNIKSDKGLLWDSANNEKSRLLLGDTIRTMRKLGMNVIQEGVENKEQLDFVVEAGANMIQGFYFSKPVCEEEFCAYVEEYNKKGKRNIGRA